MKRILDGDKVDPHALVRTGQAWLDMYEHVVLGQDTYKLLPGIYCLFTGLEMYLKAYIVLKDVSYADPVKLKSLGHKFDRMYEQITKIADHKLKLKIKKDLDHYKLRELDITDLKYPKSQRFWHIDTGLEKGNHIFGELFKSIEDEIIVGKDDWMGKVYPKTTHITVMLSSTPRQASQLQAQKWLAMCPRCRPSYVSSVVLQTSYPYDDQFQLPRECTKCGTVYDSTDLLGL
jgi:hypothetical protein